MHRVLIVQSLWYIQLPSCFTWLIYLSRLLVIIFCNFVLFTFLHYVVCLTCLQGYFSYDINTTKNSVTILTVEINSFNLNCKSHSFVQRLTYLQLPESAVSFCVPSLEVPLASLYFSSQKQLPPLVSPVAESTYIESATGRYWTHRRCSVYSSYFRLRWFNCFSKQRIVGENDMVRCH